MNAGDALCPSCQRLTSGNCGQHVPMPRPEPPLPAEIERVRKLYEDYESTPDQLTQAALLFSIPRLLARIDWLEEVLRRSVRA